MRIMGVGLVVSSWLPAAVLSGQLWLWSCTIAATAGDPQPSLRAHHHVVSEAHVEQSQLPVFADFGTMRMYDAEAHYDPLVLPCPSGGASLSGAAAGAGCCGDGQCQQSCLDQTGGCVGGYESPQSCPADCVAGVALAARRQFLLATAQPQASSLFPRLPTEIRHPEYHCHTDRESEWPG